MVGGPRSQSTHYRDRVDRRLSFGSGKLHSLFGGLAASKNVCTSCGTFLGVLFLDEYPESRCECSRGSDDP